MEIRWGCRSPVRGIAPYAALNEHAATYRGALWMRPAKLPLTMNPRTQPQAGHLSVPVCGEIARQCRW